MGRQSWIIAAALLASGGGAAAQTAAPPATATPKAVVPRTTQAPASTDPMRFTVVRGTVEDSIFADGDIVEGTAKRFEDAVREAGVKSAVVSFNSTGGLVLESVRMGQAIRKLGFATEVRAREWGGTRAPRAMCASACVYAFSGGTARYLDDTAGRLGVHQYFARSQSTGPDDLKVAQLMSSVIVGHLQEMGVSPALYVAAAMTDSGDMLWLNRADATTFDLVNDGVLPARADIRITPQGRPYLVISQIADRGETRVDISCHDGPMRISGTATGDSGALRRVRDQALRSYIRIGAEHAYPIVGGEGVDSRDGELSAARPLPSDAIASIERADVLGIGIDNVGGSWSRTIDVRGVRPEIAYYLGTCAAARPLPTGGRHPTKDG